MGDLARERNNLLALARDAKERGMLDLAQIFQIAAIKAALARVDQALHRLRRE